MAPLHALASEQRFSTFPASVRGILVLTFLEAVCAVGYSIYIVVIVSSYETDSREEYFGAGFLPILAAALLMFVATAVADDNSQLCRSFWSNTSTN